MGVRIYIWIWLFRTIVRDTEIHDILKTRTQ